MDCNNCQLTKPIPVCTLTLIIGDIAPIDTPVYIFIENISSGYIHRQEAVSSPSGLVTLDLSKPDPSFYNIYSNYSLWITLQTSTVNEGEPIIIDSIPYDCLQLHFSPYYDEDDNFVQYNTHKLEPIITI